MPPSIIFRSHALGSLKHRPLQATRVVLGLSISPNYRAVRFPANSLAARTPGSLADPTLSGTMERVVILGSGWAGYSLSRLLYKLPRSLKMNPELTFHFDSQEIRKRRMPRQSFPRGLILFLPLSSPRLQLEHSRSQKSSSRCATGTLLSTIYKRRLGRSILRKR
jgi:hypothetical protein